MADKRIYDLGTSIESSRRDLYLQVDKDDLNEAQSLKLSNLLSTAAVSGQGSTSENVALTPAALTATVASNTVSGILKTSSDATAITGTDTARAVVPANLPSFLDSKFVKTKSYSDSDFDIAASNVDTISVTAFDEMVVGEYVVMKGVLSVTNDSNVVNLEIILNATKTPLTLSQAGVTRFSSPYYISHGAVIVTSSGKLKIEISNSDGGDFGAGTHQLYFTLTYLAG